MVGGSGNIRVAVLGAAGFIGLNVVRQLAHLGVPGIFAAARHIPDVEPLPGLAWHSVDLLDRSAVTAFFAATKPTHVINCVVHGTTPSRREFDLSFRTNMTAALFAYRAANANGALRYVHLGTCEEYGHRDKAVGEDEPLAPEGNYAVSKAAGTYLLLEEAGNCRYRTDRPASLRNVGFRRGGPPPGAGDHRRRPRQADNTDVGRRAGA